MANRGKNSNGSQFFLTYRPCQHLDYKHTVFGKVIGGLAVLDLMEQVETDKKERPKTAIKITEVCIFNDPFEEWQQEKAQSKNAKELPKEQLSSAKRERTEVHQIGKYLPITSDANTDEALDVNDSSRAAKVAKVRKTLGHSTFDNW